MKEKKPKWYELLNKASKFLLGLSLVLLLLSLTVMTLLNSVISMVIYANIKGTGHIDMQVPNYQREDFSKGMDYIFYGYKSAFITMKSSLNVLITYCLLKITVYIGEFLHEKRSKCKKVKN